MLCNAGKTLPSAVANLTSDSRNKALLLPSLAFEVLFGSSASRSLASSESAAAANKDEEDLLTRRENVYVRMCRSGNGWSLLHPSGRICRGQQGQEKTKQAQGESRVKLNSILEALRNQTFQFAYSTILAFHFCYRGRNCASYSD